MSRAVEMLRWAVHTFGAIALDRHERAARFGEEAIEVCHAFGMTRAEIDRIADRVWERGHRQQANPGREIGQAMLCLECLGETTGVPASDQADHEFARVQTIPKSEWRRRHDAKVREGFAHWAPGDEPPENP